MLKVALESRLGTPRRASDSGALGCPEVWRTPSGVEVAALEVPAAADRAMTEAWRRQRRNRATPLLLLVETENGLSALGPEGTHPTPQRVEPSLLDAMDFLAARDGLETTVERLAATITAHTKDVRSPPGLRAAGLFTPHFLFRRLPRTMRDARMSSRRSRRRRGRCRCWSRLSASPSSFGIDNEDAGAQLSR
jgi:hypothetical protein